MTPRLENRLRLLAYSLLAIAFLICGGADLLAQGTAQTNLVAIADDVEASVNYVLPIAMTIAGLLIVWAIATRVLKRVAR